MTKFLLILIVIASALAAGCRTGGDTKPDPEIPPVEEAVNAEKKAIPANIVHVNRQFAYVVLENHSDHPAGSVLIVYRNQLPVARIRVTEPGKGNLITADVLSGSVEKGDIAFTE